MSRRLLRECQHLRLDLLAGEIRHVLHNIDTGRGLGWPSDRVTTAVWLLRITGGRLMFERPIGDEQLTS